MIRIKKTFAKGFFLFQGRASANSAFIEDLSEARQFIILSNYYLKGYLKIHEYLLTQDGWCFIVRVHSLSRIQKTLGLDTKVALDEQMLWRLISERMRILLSTFVKFTNRKQGRTGSKVHSSYERYIFETLIEAESYINNVRKGLINLSQRKKKYRAKKSHYKIPKKLGKGSVFMSSRKLRKRFKQLKKRLQVLEIKADKKYVLRNSVIYTKLHSIFTNSPKFHQKI